MFTNYQLWSAIDAVARMKGWSLSRLATEAGLDPSALGKTKRFHRDGSPHWVSTRTLMKILEASGLTIREFAEVIRSLEPEALERGDEGRSRRHAAGWE